MGKCAKCNEEINYSAGYYNYPSGAMCAKCGKQRVRKVEKALNDEILKMAKELKQYKRLR